MASNGDVRAFVAIELDIEVQAALGRLLGRFRRAPLGRLGRWVSPEGIHLTLKFLGDVPQAHLGEVQQALARACAEVSPFEISIAGVGCFPSARRPRVIWVGVDEPTGALTRLQRAVERELSTLGYRPEARGFTPHLTLARIRDQAPPRERAALGAWLQRQPVGRIGAMRVGRVSLMRSVLRAEGAVYSCLGTALLEPGEE